MNLTSPENKRLIAELVRDAVAQRWQDLPLDRLEEMIEKRLEKVAKAAREIR